MWGSALPGWLGVPQNPGTDTMVSAEVSRVLNALIAAQQQMVTATAIAGTRSTASADDLIAAVNSVSAVQGTRPDAIQVLVSLTTQGGQQMALARTVST